MPATTINSENLRIGELARRTGRSVHTIRWYESQGLIPGVVRDDSGRRTYDQRHVGWLELIERLRTTGMSVAQMRQYTALVRQGKSTLRQQQALLRAHRRRVAGTVAQWNAALALLDHKIDFYSNWLARGARTKQRPRAELSRGAKHRGRPARFPPPAR